MEWKTRIGLLTLTIFIASLIFTFFDALVTIEYDVIPDEVENKDFSHLVLHGPIWWKINTIVFIVLITTGLICFLLGADLIKRPMRKDHVAGLLIIILTFLTISASGLGDIMSQSFNEILREKNAFAWIDYEWWWTKYLLLPFAVSSIAGHEFPSGVDMAVSSSIGLVIIVLMWLRYYGKYEIAKIIKMPKYKKEEHFGH